MRRRGKLICFHATLTCILANLQSLVVRKKERLDPCLHLPWHMKDSRSQLKGKDLLESSIQTKSTAFSEKERADYGLEGLLPPAVEDIEHQAQRVFQQLGHKTTDLDRYIYLIQVLDENETLFYHVVMSDPARFLPILYDPTVAEACLKFGHIYRRPRGMYVSIKDAGHVRDVLKNWPISCPVPGIRRQYRPT
jgi:hypothetical protein